MNFHLDMSLAVILFCLFLACWERADLLALLYVMFSYVFVTFPFGVMGQVWYLILSFPDLCLPPYFDAPKVNLLCVNNTSTD